MSKHSTRIILTLVIAAAGGAAGLIGAFRIRKQSLPEPPEITAERAPAVVEGVHASARTPRAGVAPVRLAAPSRVEGEGEDEKKAPSPHKLPEDALDPDTAERLTAMLANAAAQMNTADQLTARVPEPEAFRLALKTRTSLVRLYNREDVNTEWAPAMEAKLMEILSKDRLERFPGLKLETECRTSSCRVTLNVPEQVVDANAPAYFPWDRPIAVLDQVFKEVWPLAPGQLEVIESATRPSVVLLFDKDSMDPEKYPAWQQSAHEKWHAAYLALGGTDQRGPFVNPKKYLKF